MCETPIPLEAKEGSLENAISPEINPRQQLLNTLYQHKDGSINSLEALRRIHKILNITE